MVDQLLPVLTPREISARDAKLRISRETGLSPERIGAVYITPCPAKIVAILEHPGMRRSNLDAAVSICDLFQTLAAAVSRVQESEYKIDAVESASGLSWAFLGKFPRSLPAENTLSVAGLPNVIRILDDIEKGRLRKYRYIECHACPEGCVGGCLTVENPYLARGKAIRLQQNLPAGCIVDRREVEIAYRKKEFLMDEYLAGRPLRPAGRGHFQGDSQDERTGSDYFGFAEDRLWRVWRAIVPRFCRRRRARRSGQGFLHFLLAEGSRGSHRTACQPCQDSETSRRTLVNVAEAAKKIDGTLVAANSAAEREIQGGYASDLLSDVMGNSREGDVWITLQKHVNVVAVAHLNGLAAIVLVNGREPELDTLAKAEEMGIPIISTPLQAFDVIGTLYSLGIRGRGQV